MNLYFNGTALDPASALVRNLFAQPAPKPVFVLGDSVTVNLYVTDGDGGYDADSGSVSVTPWLAIGNPGAEPTGGTFRLGVSSATSGSMTNGKHYLIATYVAGDDFTNVGASANETGVIFTKNNGSPTSWASGSTIVEVTDAIAYNATAATVQTALNATQAIGASGVTVTKSTAAAVYVVEWNTTGNKDAILNSVTGTLTPDSAVVVSTIRAGTSAVTEKQLVRLTQIPAALQTTWSTISNGWTATLDCNTRGLLDLLAGAGSVNAKLELQLVDGSGDIRTVGQVDCLLRNEVIDEEATIPTPLPSYLTASEVRVEASATTTNSTQTSMTFSRGSGAVAANSTVIVKGFVTARRTDADGENDGWEFVALFYRDSLASSTALVALQLNQIGATAWSIDVQADTTAGAWVIKVTGATAKTISWKAICYTITVAE